MDINSILEDNYLKEKIIINLIWANIFGIIVFMFTCIIFGIPYILLWYNKGNFTFFTFSFFENNILNNIFFVFIFLLGIFLHEFIHGIFFAKYSKNKFKSIKYGILPKEKLFTPYCHCMEILEINHYRVAIIMPTIILGIIPVIISFVIGNFSLLTLGLIFITVGCGDILMLLKLIKEKKDILIYDLPDDAGFIIYRLKK